MVKKRGVAERVRPVVGDMANPEFPPASFNLIWSEGALYNIGIENALRAYHGKLRSGIYRFHRSRLAQGEPPATGQSQF